MDTITTQKLMDTITTQIEALAQYMGYIENNQKQLLEISAAIAAQGMALMQYVETRQEQYNDLTTVIRAQSEFMERISKRLFETSN